MTFEASFPTIHVVDDDGPLRESTCQLLELEGFSPIEWKTGTDFIAHVATSDIGCVLLDLQMPGATGLQVLAHLKEARARLTAVVLTGYADVRTAVAAMRLGAADFLEKPYAPEHLLTSIENAISISVSNQPLAQEADARARIARLSPREREVLRALVMGGQNKTIARDLGVSPRTVEMHRAHMMDKLAAKSASEAMRLAYAAGLASGDGG